MFVFIFILIYMSITNIEIFKTKAQRELEDIEVGHNDNFYQEDSPFTSLLNRVLSKGEVPLK